MNNIFQELFSALSDMLSGTPISLSMSEDEKLKKVLLNLSQGMSVEETASQLGLGVDEVENLFMQYATLLDDLKAKFESKNENVEKHDTSSDDKDDKSDTDADENKNQDEGSDDEEDGSDDDDDFPPAATPPE